MENEEETLVIPHLCQLIEPHMMSERSRVISTKYSRLSSSADNRSRLFKIEVKLVNTTTGEDWTLLLVAKTLPEQKENKNFSAQIQRQFINEVGIYMSAKPSLEVYLCEKGIKNGTDFFATPFGGRLNLNEDDTVDNNAVLILRNYIPEFKKIPVRTGFDLECSKLILKALAKFHGTFLGLIYHKPKEFNENVRPYLSNYYIPECLELMTREHMIQVLQDKGFPLNMIERAVATFDRKSIKEAIEPWATFTHNNTSVNNVLIKFDSHGKPRRVKLLDFGKSEYTSPLRDVLFFLFSSVEIGILMMCLDDLIDCYYYSLISTLKRLNVDQGVLYCRLRFNRELKMAAGHSEFYHILCMLYTGLARPLNKNSNEIYDGVPKLQDSLHKKRLCYIAKEFENRGWLNLDVKI